DYYCCSYMSGSTFIF
nr:immunoglobulin light chain junction region [Macaca mulatta]MOX34072.1 immunoglobulin light chain junction region [Macaca mulatta]